MWSRLALVFLVLLTSSRVAAAPFYAWGQPEALSRSAKTISAHMALPKAPMPGVISTAGDQIGPSFECATATTPLPRLICSNPQLAVVDLLLIQAYQALRGQLDERGKAEVRSEALEFHQDVMSECGLPDKGPVTLDAPLAVDCVQQHYIQQRNTWLSRLGSDAREEAVRPIRRHMELQRILQQLNFLSSFATVDGVYGPETRKAISEWQTSKGLNATGILSDYHARLLENTPAELAAARAAEEQRQHDEEQRKLALERERERQRLEQERWERDRAAAQQKERSLFQARWNACKAYQPAACDAALQSADIEQWQRTNLIGWRSVAVQFASDVQSCKGGSAPACEMALNSPAASPRDQAYLSQWREAASPWSRFWKSAGETAGAVVVSMVHTIATTPVSTLIAGAVAFALAIALAVVLGMSRRNSASPVTDAQRSESPPDPVERPTPNEGEEPRVRVPPAPDYGNISGLHAPAQAATGERTTAQRSGSIRTRAQPESAPGNVSGLYAPSEIPQASPAGVRPLRRREISSGRKAAGVAVNVFFPGIGTLVAGRYGAGVCQLGLNVTAAVCWMTFFLAPLGFVIGFGNWVWAIASAAGAPTQPVRVVVENGQITGHT
jgi:peptidoglycan hydrolase-like protein with peptidoglycan-binding domain/TM2 domain-containing membrane protein YozV